MEFLELFVLKILVVFVLEAALVIGVRSILLLAGFLFLIRSKMLINNAYIL